MDALGMTKNKLDRILVVSPYPPLRDGIATYAAAEVRALLVAGHHVEVVSPRPSAAHHVADPGRLDGATTILRLARKFDRVIIQVFPEFLFAGASSRADSYGALGALIAMTRMVPVDLRVHELDYSSLATTRVRQRLMRQLLRSSSTRSVHTRAEQVDLESFIGTDVPIDVVEHGRYFASASTLTRAAARREIGVDDERTIFLSIGFLQHHKGFDRGIRAFAGVQSDTAELHVVGDVRVDHPHLLDHADELADLAARVDRATLHRGYLGDGAFDSWILASDVVVLPYREIWSSGVVERARLHKIPIIASDVGGLAEQLPEGSILVRSDEELGHAMAGLAGTTWKRPNAGYEHARTIEDVQKAISTAGRGGVSRPRKVTRVASLVPAVADSPKPLLGPIKRLVSKATAWQIRPVIDHVNGLRSDLDALANQVEDGSGPHEGRP